MAEPVTLYHYKNGNLHTHNGVAASLHEGCQLVGEFVPVEESIGRMGPLNGETPYDFTAAILRAAAGESK